jgi:uncharacterized membrane protein
MFEDAIIGFERPGWLLLALLILPAYLIARQSIGGLSALKTHVTFAIRAVVILLLAMALAKPTLLKKGEGLAVMVILDRSRSVPLDLQQRALDYLYNATAPGPTGRKAEDRLGIITVGDGAAITALPSKLATFEAFQDNLAGHEATSIEDGIDLALATAPRDSAIRFVLVSDGNETEGHMLEAAKRARSNDIPIDVLPLRFSYDREVRFDRIVAPARAREGQVTSLRLIMRAQAETTGTLTLSQNGVPIDLDEASPGSGIHITLQPGLNSRNLSILFDEPGPQQFEAKFEADDAASDPIAQNNSAVAVTFVGGEGRVLIISDAPSESDTLASALEDADLSVLVEDSSYLNSLVMLAGFDAVVMINQPRALYTPEMDVWLHDYVHDLGGGLIMVGGPQSFGNGGWIGSETEKALPVKLDPPQQMERQQGALALIMHSCEMPQGNYWGQKVAEAAINALSSLDYVGILDYDWASGGVKWEWGPDLVGDKSGALAATQNMPVGDMPDFDTAMQLAHEGLQPLRANKHCIIISDGDPQAPSQAVLQDFMDAQITVTTVMVAGHGSATTMQKIANMTGGRFYNVTNPNNLPQIFIEESRIVARSLTVEGDEYFFDLRNPLTEPIRGFREVPSVDGYVLTAPKEGLAEVPFTSDKHGDPLYASWNYGIGKAIAFTPDLSGLWGSRWVAWSGFRGFWDQSVRWAMRPVSPSNMTVQTRMEGDRAIVEVEAFDANEQFLNYLNSSAMVLGPGGTEPLTMQQVGPGKYRGEFDVDDAGAYLVSVQFTNNGESAGNLQAAINVPYAREFRDVSDNEAELLRVARETEGRVLHERAELADLWNREGLQERRSHRPIWDLLAIIAATIFLFDVAGRRLSIGLAETRAAMSRLIGRRAAATEDTVAAWKKARAQVIEQRQSAAKRAEASAPAADASVKFEATEEDKETAMDVGADLTDESLRDKPPTPQRRAKPKPSEQDQGDFTSRLLAAKKRARQQSDEKKD